MNHPQTTIKDIARDMGVSPSTVSRILNGKYNRKTSRVSEILRIAEESKYKPSVTALGLRMNKSFLVGVVVPRMNNEFYSEILSGLQETLDHSNYKAIICQSNDDPEKELDQIESLLAIKVDGIILSPSKNSRAQEVAEAVGGLNKKLLLVDRLWQDAINSYVKVDDIKGASEITNHLIERGNKCIGYVGFNRSLINDLDRERGYRQALASAGMTSPGTFYFDDINGQPDFFKLLLNDHPQLDALFCFNDEIALYVLNELKKNNKKVPDDIALAGFDNRKFCEFITPPLTSAEHYALDIGKMSAIKLIGLIEGEVNSYQMVPPKLIIRGSSDIYRS